MHAGVQTAIVISRSDECAARRRVPDLYERRFGRVQEPWADARDDL